MTLEGSVPEDDFHQGLVSSVKRGSCQPLQEQM